MNLFPKIKLLLATMALAGISCSDGYLETTPSRYVTPETVYKTTKDAYAAVNGMCKLMSMQYLATQGLNGEGTIKMYYGNYPGNHFMLDLASWSPIINSTWNENISSTYTNYPWYYYYMIVGNANSLLEYIDEAEGEASERYYRKAQALTFRAYSYMMLAQLYCYRWDDSDNGQSNGLVLRIDTSTGDLELSNLADTYRLIYSDLDEAIRLYSASTGKRGSNYEPDINVAYSIYARASLNRKDYVSAAEYAFKARQGYPLMDNDDYKGGFFKPTDEWIWSSYGAADETLHYFSYHAYIAYNSSASSVRITPKCISRELYNKIPETDIRKGLFLDPAGYEYETSTGIAETGTALREHAYNLFDDLQASSIVYAYMQFKIACEDQPGVGHLNHFRSSEMYLIEAEANYFLGKEEVARSLLEELTRDTGRDEAYECVVAGAQLLEEIKLYRAIELWGEGFDWFDMKRWGDPIERKTYQEGGNFIASLAISIEPDDRNKWTWVIPSKEVDYNGALE